MNTNSPRHERSYLLPFLSMVLLFFIVGFLTTANAQFQAPLRSAFLSQVGGMKNSLVTLITFSWFLAYPLTGPLDRKSTRLNSSHANISYAVFCLKKKK